MAKSKIASNQIAPSAEPASISNKIPRQFIPTPNRRDRRTQFGIDCAELVHFTHWEPGSEHVKQLIIKNVVMKTQKIKYKLPHTRYFSMEFPETVTLSAGMSLTVPITFRPVAKECYDDVIEFTTSFGKFLLPIKASLPEHVLEFPLSIDFSYCPIKETAKQTFTLKNEGELTSYYEWQIPKPFAIYPSSGTLVSGASETVRIEFIPQNACTLQATAVCTFGDKERWDKSKVFEALEVSGIGKYSHIAVVEGENTFSFGDVFVNKFSERTFTLENQSEVVANYAIRKSDKNTDPYFEFSHYSGRLQPNERVSITIKFTPVSAGMDSIDYFDIATISGNTIKITCTGKGVGPSVFLSAKSLNFGDVLIGNVAARSITLENKSNTVAFYQFLCEPNGIFRLDKPWGTVGPSSSLSLTIRFSGNETINYYRRIYCLVDNQDALYIDFLGTAYNDKKRPATFSIKHITNYQQRILNGLWSFGPEHLEEMLKNGIIESRQGILSFVDAAQKDKMVSHKILDSPYQDGLIASEYFYENTGDTLACTLLDTYVDFGSCSRYKVIEPQIIRIANNTTGKMACVWVMPGDLTGESQDSTAFSVTPAMTDIPAKSVVEFKIHFRPDMDNSFYGAQLECFVYFKSMRNFRLVQEDTLTPPWCMTPMIAGNTFPPGEDTFIPKVKFGDTRLDFPACHVDKSVYRTIRVSNTGDTPVKFSFIDQQLSAKSSKSMELKEPLAFAVKPRFGLLHSNESRLIVFRFAPSEQKLYENALKCFFNSSSTNSHDLQVRGEGFYSQLSFENQNTLCFRPTCIGAVSKREFFARNTTRISVKFEWKIPTQYTAFVSIEPISGVLQPNSKLAMHCTFSPTSTKDWIMKIPCYYTHTPIGSQSDNSVGSPGERQTLTVFGRGSFGKITANPDQIDFDVILVNTIAERDITLFNSSECDIYYSLEIWNHTNLGQVSEGQETSIDSSHDGSPPSVERKQNNILKSELEIVQHSHVLPARSSHSLKLRACVREQKEYHFTVFYRLESQDKTHTDSERMYLCQVNAKGVHPLVQVMDIRCDELGKSFLWQMFGIDFMNSSLEQISPDPMAYADFSIDLPLLNDRNTTTSDSFIDPITFDFGATPVGYKPTVVSIVLKNIGVVAVDWIFLFPNNLDIEFEGWADPGEYSEDQINQNFILDKQLFTVVPKSGFLAPGESAHVLISYSHEFAGLHKLPVIFKLKNGSSRCGKEVILQFLGYSVVPSKNFLQITSLQHEFEAMPAGISESPIQMYRLLNRGTIPIQYELDLSGLEALRNENDGFEIFKVRKSKGIIQPRDVQFIEWTFRPLAPKSYQVDVPIVLADGKPSVVTFSGKGYSEPLKLIKSDPKDYSDSIPIKQLFTFSNQIASVSIERLNFGQVPLGAILRQVVAIRNESESSEIIFNWKIPSYWGTDSLRILPSSGTLRPGESKVCKVCFIPKEAPRIYDLEIFCEITDKTLLDVHGNKKAALEKAWREGQYLAVESLSRNKTPKNPNEVTKTDLSQLKYKTLPPINNFRPDTGLSSAEPEFVELGPPPEPSQLILTLKAKSFDVNDFRTRFYDYETFYFEKKMYMSSIQDADFKLEMLDSLEDVLLSVLDDLLLDPDVTCLSKVENYSNLELFPYYAQLTCGSLGIYTLDSKSGSTHDIKDTQDTKHVTPDFKKSSFEENRIKQQILGSLEFQNFTESILEGTLYNLIQEANADEFDMTRYPMMFQK